MLIVFEYKLRIDSRIKSDLQSTKNKYRSVIVGYYTLIEQTLEGELS